MNAGCKMSGEKVNHGGGVCGSPQSSGDDMQAITNALSTLNLPDDAQRWLLDVWAVSQAIDDAHDGDKSDHAVAAARAAFGSMHVNAFFEAKRGALIPMMALQAEKWEAANIAEREGRRDARSYMWRAGFYDLTAMVCLLCGLPAIPAVNLYGETFADYMNEAENA